MKADACELCGRTKELQRHHPDIEGRPDDVVVLCVHCHNDAHARMAKGWGRERWG